MTLQAQPHLPVRRTSSLVVTPAVVGHRGTSGYLPEHTLEAYRLAIRLGADDIELDLVSTSDGVLLARHESDLTGTTDVATRADLADRRTTRLVEGTPVTGWFVEDLTAEELRSLRARERFTELRSTDHDDELGVPTLDEVLAMVGQESEARGRSVGVMLELKDPAASEAMGLPLEDPLTDALRRHGLDHSRSRITVMSFEPTILRRVSSSLRVPVVQLVEELHLRPADLVAAGDSRTYADLVTPAGLAEIERYADGIGARHTLVARDAGDRVLPTSLVADAHREWLSVHVWTLRAENSFLPRPFRDDRHPAGLGDLRGYAGLLLEMGVDGLITDHPDLCLDARDLGAEEPVAEPDPYELGTSTQATR